tara:strand:+ start:266 stop:463 length:198 start_codon:yes stop_codon:yes gene_type:complete
MKTIKIIIDKFETEDGYYIYRVTDQNSEPANFCINGGWVYDCDNINDILENASCQYDIEIIEDYR